MIDAVIVTKIAVNFSEVFRRKENSLIISDIYMNLSTLYSIKPRHKDFRLYNFGVATDEGAGFSRPQFWEKTMTEYEALSLLLQSAQLALTLLLLYAA